MTEIDGKTTRGVIGNTDSRTTIGVLFKLTGEVIVETVKRVTKRLLFLIRRKR